MAESVFIGSQAENAGRIHHRHENSAMPKTNLLTTSTNLQKAVAWIGETLQQHPEKQRAKVLAEAELRFDLTPLECEFLHRHFRQPDY